MLCVAHIWVYLGACVKAYKDSRGSTEHEKMKQYLRKPVIFQKRWVLNKKRTDMNKRKGFRSKIWFEG